MKKIYTEPEFEIVDIYLVSDVLYTSTDATEEIIDPTGSGFPGEGDFFD